MSSVAAPKGAAEKATPADTTERLTKLRQVMERHNLQAYIVPSEDAHQSEYIADCDARRAFISGFTGSAGLAVVTRNRAALWTDGRYFLQASKQLDDNWVLQKTGLPDVPTKEEWLVQVLPKGSKVGIDPTLLTVGAARTLQEAIRKEKHELAGIPENLIDQIWSHRPPRPQNPVQIHPLEYAGQSVEDKLQKLREEIKKTKAWGFVVNALDEIAWLFNLRGSDIAYNPVFFAYALVTQSEAILYVDAAKLSDQVRSHLGSAVTIRPYEAVTRDLSSYAQQFRNSEEPQKLWIGTGCSMALEAAAGGEDAVTESRSPVQAAKAIKNDVELEGFRQSHIRDAAALISYFAWLEDELVNKKNTKISEVDGADVLEKLRSQQPKFVGLSFDTISSTGPNGAIIHYKPEKETCALIDVNQIYLCDSGGQYLDGTTDVTRTLHFGNPKDHEKDAFTRVLKGHIQLDITIFPKTTTGYLLDVIARVPLWKAGLDFRHGTGHGVGSYLNVHEGPQGVGTRIAYNDIHLAAGMTITNEPGYYQDGDFGIRIENVMLIRLADTPNRFGDRDYYGFEHVTVVPIQTKLIKVELLTREEREWVNAYHLECWEKVSPLLQGNKMALGWLQRETRPI
ncbi:hypothetical protein HK097_007565 [Rhizophlyctis rosea]|uniref:Xaa-Pro aminopeptidase n=1 Tax=Rhizophlyctis rosea TaxID=64517 RepID=A0AAD5SKA6_9FUNG|nr:hypothetical protein HK097_007565 [Rhizophlyctis rosea]